MMGRLDSLLGQYDALADVEASDLMRTMHTFYRTRDFTAQDFAKELAALGGATDLIILDHLHYVDTKDDNENRGYKQMVKQIRDAALLSGKPVIVVAHVRKSDRREHAILPGMEDFHGSSDIPKISTKAIMLAPDMDSEAPARTVFPTYMQVVKCRTDSSVTRYAARLMFDVTKDCYLDQYKIGRVVDGGTVFNELSEEDCPAWSRREEATVREYGDSRFAQD
jgi:hypothetical protein